ncbi:phenylalanine--tRNA ligase subunit alpha [Candidatus Erwinia haradaeae]|uniref:Phenylalanine--tRNA ligase alpha subunit n=1 Tax=Candidatus Erwinia haradaeae TaxID=1922217 RepID=A0A451D1U1_9GAMM|nr:phenylalanine--tRNA ligase subunit alpha [Candidatus Erwinia haradaeae]VFP79576.1 Phenylalanine--tRNA ligase alpha subunit [Candidatus Erwinia haradaeae]
MLYLDNLVQDAQVSIKNAKDFSALDHVRITYLGKNGYLTLQMISLRRLAIKERSLMGSKINSAKQQIQNALKIRKKQLESEVFKMRLITETIDVSLPGRQRESGGSHPVMRTMERIEAFFCQIGFLKVTGPEIEDSYHNFDALNISRHHPARNNHDTFWLDSTRLLRTQTSVVQIRTMQKQKPPIRVISPGRVYRNDYDRTHSPMFHQMEGFFVDKNVSFANLKSILLDFLKNFFEDDIKIRFRPSYFPFTEPSAEVDIMNDNGKWLEILGCGLIHPNVLNISGIDSNLYSGFAFGMGIERLTMIRYGISDLRCFFENDLRFLKQFK